MKTYIDIIKDNVEYLEGLENIVNDFELRKYKEPDGVIETTTINGVEIKISTDGICSIKKSIQFSKNNKDIISNYKITRENKYLRWPAYMLSINQQRSYKSKFDDRIDLLLLDIKELYNILVNNENQEEFSISYQQIKQIKEKCKLEYAYLNIHTLIWLKSFKSFDAFIAGNRLQMFCESVGGHYIVERWSESEFFDEKYFNKLIAKCKTNKAENGNLDA